MGIQEQSNVVQWNELCTATRRIRVLVIHGKPEQTIQATVAVMMLAWHLHQVSVQKLYDDTALSERYIDSTDLITVIGVKVIFTDDAGEQHYLLRRVNSDLDLA